MIKRLPTRPKPRNPARSSGVAASALQDRLTREMHHRVKNNLQIMASIVSLQARDADGDEARRAHAVIGVQIHTLTLVHRWQHEQGDGRQIDLRAMIADLCRMLDATLLLPGGARVAMHCEGSSGDGQMIGLHPDHAMPVAFLITELAILAARPGEAGTVPVHVTAHAADGMISITVASPSLAGANLAGRPDGEPAPRLITAMARQLHATVEQDVAVSAWSIRFAASPP